MTVTERTAWTTRLAHIPSWAMSEELARRGEADETDATVRLPGLVVDPVGSTITWRGEEYALGGRQMEVLYLLATARARGRRRVRTGVIAGTVWRGWERAPGANLASTNISWLRKRFPGLIVTRMRGTYELAIDEPDAAPTERVA